MPVLKEYLSCKMTVALLLVIITLSHWKDSYTLLVIFFFVIYSHNKHVREYILVKPIWYLKWSLQKFFMLLYLASSTVLIKRICYFTRQGSLISVSKPIHSYQYIRFMTPSTLEHDLSHRLQHISKSLSHSQDIQGIGGQMNRVGQSNEQK